LCSRESSLVGGYLFIYLSVLEIAIAVTIYKRKYWTVNDWRPVGEVDFSLGIFLMRVVGFRPNSLTWAKSLIYHCLSKA